MIGFPEVHADGEIWAQTLWDLRARARVDGRRVAGDPGDGALAGQPVVPGRAQRDPAGRHRGLRRRPTGPKIWAVFAHRGMGWFAGAANGDDSTTFEDFSLPPKPGAPKGSVAGDGQGLGHRQAGTAA